MTQRNLRSSELKRQPRQNKMSLDNLMNFIRTPGRKLKGRLRWFRVCNVEKSDSRYIRRGRRKRETRENIHG